MRFFSARGGYYPASRIEQIIPIRIGGRSPDDNDPKVTVWMQGGSPVEARQSEIDRLSRATSPVLPAQPGLYLLTFWYDPEDDDQPGPGARSEPILAWRIGQHGGAEPIVLDFEFEEMEDRHAMLDRNTGRVHHAFGDYDSEAAWIAQMKTEADEKRARAAQPH